MEQEFLTEALGPDKRSQMFKYLIGEKPDFECHGGWPVPSIQFFYRTWMLELELIVYPVCLPGQTSSWRLIAVSLLGSPFLSLYVLIRLTINGSEAGADANKDGKCQAWPEWNQCVVSALVLNVNTEPLLWGQRSGRRRVRWSWIPCTQLVGESWQLTEPWLGPVNLILQAIFPLK